MILRSACMDEVDAIYRCIEDARAYHAAMGFVQWHAGYPTVQTIRDDLAAQTGYVFAEGGEILGYCCIMLGEDPAYRVIDGAWKTDRPYAVAHRMAFGAHCRGTGLSQEAFSLMKAFCVEHGMDAIRVDTQEENKVTQHILEREGFQYCGTILFDGSPKLAYEWDR